MGSRRIFQISTPTPMNIDTAGISSGAGHMSTVAIDQVLFVQGNAGPIDITANPQIEFHTIPGAKLTIIGMSNTNKLTLENGNGLVLNGTAELGLNDVLELLWCGDNYLELGRNF